MRIHTRTLSAAVFAAVLLLSAAGCKKKVAAAPPPPPALPKEEPAPPPPPPKPAPARIDAFTVEPNRVDAGQAATLRWSVANSTDMSIDQGIGTVQANGSRQVTPNATTTYTLTARSGGGNDTRSVTLTVNAAPPPPPPPPAPKVTISSRDILARDVKDVYFDYDKSDLRPDAQATARANAQILKQIFSSDPGFSVVIEGHCDERGSAEYNLGLGDRRATAYKDFLVQQGVPADKLKTFSLGKEMPVCTEATEDCYQRNRRGHLSPQ